MVDQSTLVSRHDEGIVPAGADVELVIEFDLVRWITGTMLALTVPCLMWLCTQHGGRRR